MGLRYPSRSDFFRPVRSLGDLPDDVGIRLRVFGAGATSARVIRSTASVESDKFSGPKDRNLEGGGDALPTTSPILMSFWRFGPSLTISPDKSDPINAPSGGCGAEVGVGCHFGCKTYSGTH